MVPPRRSLITRNSVLRLIKLTFIFLAAIFACVVILILSLTHFLHNCAMRTLMWTGQEGMTTAVARITGSLHGPASIPTPLVGPFPSTWQSLWHRVSGNRQHSNNSYLNYAGGASSSVRTMATATPNPSSSSSTSTDSQNPRVCILGGGFGGLYTAVKLEGLMWPRGTKPHATLIDQAERFSFKPLLYELITGSANAEEVAPPYSQLLSPYPVTFVRGRVAAVRPDTVGPDSSSQGGGTVLLASGEALPYDWLVLALGAETSTFGVPGVKEHAVPFSSYDDALKINSQA